MLPPETPMDVVGYACTSGAALIGPARVAESIRFARSAGTPGAFLRDGDNRSTDGRRGGLPHLGLQRLGFVSPYIESVSAKMREALEAAGLKITAFGSFEQSTEHAVARIAPDSVRQAILDVGRVAACDGVFVSCTNVRTLAILQRAEDELGLPVISSNQALAWHMLTSCGNHAQRYGLRPSLPPRRVTPARPPLEPTKKQNTDQPRGELENAKTDPNLVSRLLGPPACGPAVEGHGQGHRHTRLRREPDDRQIRAAGELDAGAAILAPWLLQNPDDSSYFGSVAIIAKAAADALHVKLKYTDATWDTLIAGLVARKVPDRRGTDPGDQTAQEGRRLRHLRQGRHLLSPCALTVRSSLSSDLDNPKLRYLGYTGLANGVMFHEKYPDTKMQMISPPPGYGPRIPEVLKGRGDIAALDAPLAFWVHKRWPDARIIPAPKDCVTNPDLVRPIGIGYPKGDKAFATFLASVIAATRTRSMRRSCSSASRSGSPSGDS